MRSAPVAPVSVSNQMPGMMPTYYLPAAGPATTSTATVGSSRLPGQSVHSIPVGAPMLIPQAGTSYQTQPFSYLPGIIYQPVMVPPVMFQPNMAMPPISHPSFSRAPGRPRHPDHRRRHHRSSHYADRGQDAEKRSEQRHRSSQGAHDLQADYERRYMQSPIDDDVAMGAIRRTSGRNLVSV